MTENRQTGEAPVLVLAGTGKTGRRVVQRLETRGVPVRVGSRSSEPAFDWEDRETWGPALEGVRAVYLVYVPDLAFPGAPDAIRSFTELAKDKGVEHIVLLSGRGEEEAQACENIVRHCGTAWTVVRASWFNQNFSESFLFDSVLGGEIVLPAGDAAEPFTDADDIADVAATALAEKGHTGQVYELTGPRLLTFHDIADELTRALGRKISYVPVSAEEYRAMLAEHGVPTEFVDLFTQILDGRNAHLTDGVQRALGREPKDFTDFAQQTAATGVWTPPEA